MSQVQQRRRQRRRQRPRRDAGEEIFQSNATNLVPRFPPPAYPREPMCQLWVPGTTVLYGTSSGTCAGVTNMNATTNVTSWSSRFGRVFEEYRIMAVECRVRSVLGSSQTSGTGGTPSGTHFAWFDEKDSSTPGSTDVFNRMTLQDRPNQAENPKSTYTIRWKVVDPLDLEFSSTATSYNPIYFKIYTDTANFGNSSFTATAQFSCTPMYLIQFRSYKD
jgi:hypothetical protein